MEVLPDNGVEIVDEGKEKRDGERVKGDADFDQPIGADRTFYGCAPSSGQPASNRQTTHESG
jgi:hypothetical protein